VIAGCPRCGGPMPLRLGTYDQPMEECDVCEASHPPVRLLDAKAREEIRDAVLYVKDMHRRGELA
jgi:hypothetical protein